MTTIEQSFEAKPLIRNDALPPSTGSTAIERGDEQDFPPNVIPSENAALFVDAQPIAESLDDGGRKIFNDHFTEFHTSFTFKFRNEIVAQIFQSYKDDERADGSIDLQHVVHMLKTELATESFRHRTQATYLDMTAIPAARQRPVWTPEYAGDPSAYLVKDIPMLEDREEAHLAMERYIEASKPRTDDEALVHAESLVRQFLPEAKEIVDQTLSDQMDALEAEKKALDARIEALAARKKSLAGKEEAAPSNSQETQEEPLDRPGIIRQLTERARALAKTAA